MCVHAHAHECASVWLSAISDPGEESAVLVGSLVLQWGPAQLQAAPQAAPGTALHTFSVTLGGTGLTRDSGKNGTEKAPRTVPGGSAQGVLAAANNLALPFAPAGSDSGHIQHRPAGCVCGGGGVRRPSGCLAGRQLYSGTSGQELCLAAPPLPTPNCFFSLLIFPLGCLPAKEASHSDTFVFSPFPEMVLLARRGSSRGSLRVLLPLRVQPLRGERAHAGECPTARGRCAHAG